MEKGPVQNNQLDKQAKRREDFSGVYEEGVEQLRVIKTEYGTVSLASDIGIGHHENEDRVFMDTTRNLFGVADGIGGYERGSDAAQIISEEVVQGVKAKIKPSLIQFEASNRMRQQGIFMGGACYLYFQVENKTAKVVWAGDVQMMVIGSEGQTRYKSASSEISKAPRGQYMGESSTDIIDIVNYDTVIVASDGLWDNIATEDLGQMVQDMKSGETDVLTRELFKLAIKGMEEGFLTNYNGVVPDKRKDYGKKDNVSIVVFQKLPKNM